MKTITRTVLAAAALFATTLIAADQPTTNAATASKPPAELAAVERFLSLSDEELTQMADAIARVRALSSAERAALREQIAAYRKLSEPERARIRQGWGGMPAEIQNGWREMMQSASDEERAAIQAKMQSLSPDEKMKFRRNLVETYLKAKANKR